MYTFVFILFNAYSHQINHEWLTCDRVPDTRCTFMCSTCSVVLDTTHLIDFNVFSGSQPKTDGKHKNEISNIVEVNKHFCQTPKPFDNVISTCCVNVVEVFESLTSF